MKKIKYQLKNGYKIITDINEGGTLKGIENLIPSIEDLKEKDDNYIFKVFNNGRKCEVTVKARNIISVEFIF